MEESVARLLEQLAQARTFDDAAAALLGAALDTAETCLAASRFQRGRVLRAIVHLRPDDGYVGLMALEASPAHARGPVARGDTTHLPSATAWRWVKEHDRWVEIDVVHEEVSIAAGRALEASLAQRLDVQRSRAALIDRDVTHLAAAPLRAPGGRVEGMLCVEASCQAAIGQTFIWRSCKPSLDLLAAVASAYVTRLPATTAERPGPDELLPVVGAAMARVVEILRVFAEQEETILLGGPTGVGKSRLARWCHARSAVRERPFEVLDLATVPEDLQLAELFGWRRGAFTSAARDTPGSLARAEGGTLFIDEIDKLSLQAQAGMLRVLEEKRYRQLGEGAGERVANVRFIVGSNADLPDLVKRRRFREDLYFRVNVLPVRLPTLRDRKDEIVPWARYMLRRRQDGEGGAFTAEAERILAAHDWPGNLRQLDNIVRRAHALSLVSRGASATDPALGAEAVALALAYEENGGGSSVWSHWERAAEAFVSEAQRRARAGEPKLDMDVADAFKALVIDVARRRLGGDDKESVRRAFLLLGKEATLKSRNHGAHYRREADKLVEARRLLGSPPAEDADPQEPA